MTQPARPDVAEILGALKDFQRSSVEYIFHKLFQAETTNRFLLADEVGLGKTMVARGVIARVVDLLWDRQERIDIAYICSNAEIARQNINRLNIVRESSFQTSSRLTLLPLEVRNLERNRVNFIALTPGTSFDLRSSLGTAEERWMLYWLLRRAWPDLTEGVAAMNVLEGYKGRQAFRERLLDPHAPERKIDPTLQRTFVEKLKMHDRRAREQGQVPYRQLFRDLCSQFYGRNQSSVSAAMARQRNALVGELRSLLAATCIEALKPDLIVLDEFQRFKDLLRSNNDAGRLARHLFGSENARVLLLSATPYKMYTVKGEHEDDHYADFLDTVRFLLNDENKTIELERLLREYRKRLYQLDSDNNEPLHHIKEAIQKQLRQVMSRTERVSSSKNGANMLREVSNGHAALTKRDVRAYVDLQRIARLLDRGSVIEYWKSAPYLLNFMENYELKREFRQRIDSPHFEPVLRERLCLGEGQLLPLDKMNAYEPIEPANPRVRQLTHELLDNGSWRMLWLAPSLPYYRLGRPFDNPDAQQMTKRLIFSSWFLVPRSLSVLLSYESERRMMLANPDENHDYASYSNRKPLLNFTRSQGRLTGMPVLGLLYPSLTLARLGDPLEIRQQGTAGTIPAMGQMLEAVQDRLDIPLRRLIERHSQPTSAREDEAWYWAAPILLDLEEYPSTTEDWWSAPHLANEWSGEAGEEGWSDHVQEARKVYTGELSLGLPPRNLAQVLAKLALAGPAVCALRSLSRVTTNEIASERPVIRDAAGRVAWGFRTLFNLPTSINLLRGLNPAEPYWERVTDYSLAGCLQSVLDEYAHVLRESLGLIDAQPDEAALEIAKAMATAIGLHAATPQIDAIKATQNSPLEVEPHRLRARYAMRFGDEKADGNNRFRGDDVRQAFNSPFRPFALITTSVGQEGLDFHPYCHAIIHWNLPSNPVDLEQREGRIHRYKGHAVRRNVAECYGTDLQINDQADPWQHMFQRAASEPDRESDLSPFWIYPKGKACIERHVPMLPMSREIGRLAALRRSLALYRMVFGQPRQEDLLDHLLRRLPRDRILQQFDQLQIDLTPPRSTLPLRNQK